MIQRLLVQFWLAATIFVLVALGTLNPALFVKSQPLLSYTWLPKLSLFFSEVPITPVRFEFRGGPSRLGTTSQTLNFPLEIGWTTLDLNHGIHQAAKSSPAVDASGLYVGSDTGWIFAFDLHGQLRWKFYTKHAVRGIHGTAILDDQAVYIGSYNGRFYALDKTTGKPFWIADLADAVGTAALPLGNDLLISAETGSSDLGIIYKLNRKTGATVWRTNWLEGQIHSSPTLSDDGQLFFVGSNSGNYLAFDIGTGREVWRVNLGGEIKGIGAAHQGVIYITSWAQKLFALEQKTGKILWSSGLDGKSQGSPVVIPELQRVFINSNRSASLHAFQLDTGKEVWKKPLNTTFSYGSALGFLSKTQWYLAVHCEATSLCIFNAKTGRLEQNLDVGQPFSSTPALFDGKMYISQENGPLLELKSARGRP